MLYEPSFHPHSAEYLRKIPRPDLFHMRPEELLDTTPAYSYLKLALFAENVSAADRVQVLARAFLWQENLIVGQQEMLKRTFSALSTYKVAIPSNGSTVEAILDRVIPVLNILSIYQFEGVLVTLLKEVLRTDMGCTRQEIGDWDREIEFALDLASPPLIPLFSMP